MKALALLLAAGVTVASLLGLAMSAPSVGARIPLLLTAADNTTAPAKLSLTLDGGEINGNPRFSMGAIFLPQVPITLNITFFNNESASGGMDHTFTVDDSNGNHVIDSGLLAPQHTIHIEFTVNSLTNITYNGTSFKPLDPGNGTIQYFCIPHQALGMVGYILMAGAPTAAAQPAKGVPIRAYWIGIIAFVAMLVWIGIAYFVIKSSSPRFRDHREHLRRGLP